MRSGELRSINFIYLTAFSSQGGIEKFNRCFCKALGELQHIYHFKLRIISAYDRASDERYASPEIFRGYGGNRIKFSFCCIFQSIRAETVIIGHINLAPIGLIIKWLWPKKKVVLISHGVEVWEKASGIKKFFLQKTDAFLTVSEFTRQKLIAANAVAEKKISVFPNALDPFFPQPDIFDKKPPYLIERYGLSKDDFIFLTVNRLSSREQYKGYDKVISAINRLPKEKQKNIKYLIAGKSDSAEYERVKKLIKTFHLENVVLVTGFIPENELIDTYLLADLFIMPSLGEGFGIVFLEAIACGIPVAGGNRDGSAEALRYGELGKLVDPLSVEDIQNLLRIALEKPKEKSDMIRKRELMRSYFSFEKFTERLEKALLNLGKV